MGACCCKNEKPEESQPNEPNQTEQKPKPMKPSIDGIELPTEIIYHGSNSKLPNLNHNNDSEIENNDLSNDRNNEENKSPTHWKTETLQLLNAISHNTMFDLGSEFDDYLYDKLFYSDGQCRTVTHTRANTQTVLGPKQLINIPRKRYVAYTMTNAENIYDLQIGSTLNKSIEQETNEQCVWQHCNASNFKLRSIEYCTNKKSKLSPSKNALYNVIAVDCFEIDDVSAANMDLTEMISLLNIKHRERESIYPAMIIMSLMVPLFKKKHRNGLHLLLYASISADIDYNDAALPLLNKLINFDAFVMDNFKMSVAIQNISKTKLNPITKKLVKTINRKCMAFKKHASYEYLDNDKQDIFIINFNGFGLNKKIIKGLSTIRNHLETIDFEIAFHIGAKVKNVLPERVLLCATINRLNLNRFIRFDAFCAKKEDEYNQNHKTNGHCKTVTYVMDDVDD